MTRLIKAIRTIRYRQIDLPNGVTQMVCHLKSKHMVLHKSKFITTKTYEINHICRHSNI